MSLNGPQVDALLQPLDGKRVRQVQGNSHLEAWDIRRHLLRVFGWGGWAFEIVSCDCILERSVWESEKHNETHKGRHTVAYRVLGRLTIKDPSGVVLAVFEDGATGDAQNQPGFADAHDMALKTAMSQALKRCAINLGDRFGLSLYAKGSTAAVVGKSLAHTHSTEHDTVEAVEAGEMDQPKIDGGNDAPHAPSTETGGERPPLPARSDPVEAARTALAKVTKK